MNQAKSTHKDINFIKECVDKYRSRLLDTSKRNSLISFNHSERSRQHIRVIDELPDFLYGEFLDGKTLTFNGLPNEEDDPPDEKTPEFRSYLERAKLTDEAYIEAIDAVDQDEEGAPDKIEQIEHDLRNKIREELGLPVWKEQKSLTNAEVAKKHDLNPSYEMPEPTPENQEDAARHIDKLIQTLLKPEEMNRKLSGLNSYVRSDIEESGVNTLYVAFGFLQWYESENSDKPCVSPLLLLQLQIYKEEPKKREKQLEEKKKRLEKAHTYLVQATGKEPEVSLSISELSERLRKNFGIKLPELTVKDGPETYITKVSELIKKKDKQLEKEKKQLKKGYTYRVWATGEEPEVNLSISERLREDFGIELPELTVEDGPETYMTKVSELIKEAKVPKKEKWRVRRFITIGRFRFARLVMFHDLNEKKWPGDTDISTNDIVQNLFTGSDSESSSDYAEDYDIDTPEVEEAVPLLITSADASQHSALVDVMKGKNLVIKGPPGTGKSQTITNIIANALAKGKTVLFLAEKMAALNVVHKRLSNANLSPYCLELHSTKAKKTEVLKSIEERLKLRSSNRNGGYLASKLQEFKRHRDYITEYIDALNSGFGRQNKTIYEYLWSAQLRKDRIGDLLSSISQTKIPFEQADLTKEELSPHTEKFQNIVALKKNVEKESDNGRHPWGFVGNFSLNPFQQDELKELVRDWIDHLKNMQDTLTGFTERFNLSITPNSRVLQSFLDDTETLAHWVVDDLDQALIEDLGTINKAEALASFVEDIHAYRQAQEEITTLKDISDSILHLKEIERHAMTAKELDADDMTALDIRAKAKALKEEYNLWNKNLETLLGIGEHFGISKNEDIDKIYALAEVPDYIASVPRDYLLFRTRGIIDETNSGRLKKAADTQRRIRSLIEDQEMKFDLSMMGPPHEIRVHAAALDNAGFFAFLDSSYRQAKKLYTLSSKHKRKFKADKASATLRAIAETKEEHQKIEQDTQLQAICGSFYNGFDTDFEKLQKINEWARSVRKRYTAANEFTRNVRQWLLTAEMEELDPVRDLAEDDKFIALKDKISDIKDDVSPDTPVQKYLYSLVSNAEKFSGLKTVLQHIAASDDITFADITADLPRLQNAAETKISVEKNQIVKQIFGDQYAGAKTDIQGIEQTARFVSDCLAVSFLKDSLEIFLNTSFSKHWHEFVENRNDLKEQHEAVKEQASQTQEHLHINLSSMYDVEGWEDMPFADLIALFKSGMDKPDSLNNWITLNTYLSEAAQDIKGGLLDVYDKENLDFETLPLAFEYMIYSTVAREIYKRNPVISSTNGLRLEQARACIKELDREILELHQDELCNALNKARPMSGYRGDRKSTYTEGALLKHEISKQRRHISIRDLMKRAGQSIQKIKPCFLMSPLTVAQYLEPGKFSFDLVVIDEASQMRPEDALGSVARAKQIVVVGDQMQLPPTSFFQSASKDDEDEEEDFSSEAIMDMALSSFRPSRILNRHYRSQHESLIAFSNYHFYDESLVLFPSPVKNPDELGVRLEYVGGTYASKSNMDEIQAVVKAALDFMRKHPDRSLGIATMNQVQKDLIEIEMDRAFIDHPHAANYKAKWQSTLESFFVKNLESVQGDERDAIFISTVYGPDKNGIVMQRFGPINHVGGHRRLNVLFTRAKKNMVVFTSLKPEDIKISDNSSQGIRALKGFLSYASKGVIDEGEETHRDPDSDFEICVKEKLESIGCEVHPQVGVAGYRIDLGVKHPKYPYGYLMGVECDGATYHSSKSARERDAIRQKVLEELGWRIHRIWSTDWFSNSTQEFEKLKNHIKELLNSEDLKASKTDDFIVEPDFMPGSLFQATEYQNNADVEQEDLFQAAEYQDNADAKNVVELFDNVTYFMVKDDGKTEKRSVQIVPTQGDPNAGTITRHSPIGRALLGGYSGEEIECTLPIGEVTLEILSIDKYIT